MAGAGSRSAAPGSVHIASLGTLPNWSYGSPPQAGGARPISARDITDLRSWIQRYQDATGISYQPVDPIVGPLRGLHLTTGMDMRQQDVSAAQAFNPGLVVVLSGDVLRPTTLSYLKSLSPNVEIFCRYAPTTFPALNYTTWEGYNSWLNNNGQPVYVQAPGSQAIQRNPPDVAQDIVNLFDSFRSNGLTITRFYPGNEPETEWFNGSASLIGQYGFFSNLWRDLNAYYRDVYHQLQLVKGTRAIELYPPAFAQFAAVGVGNYNPDGSVSRQFIDGVQGQTGLDLVRSTIEYYTNGTTVGRVNWHSYFWPGRQAQQSAYAFFPGWLQADIANGFPARVTEYGWFPNCFAAGGCNGVSANLDSTVTTCGPPSRSISSWGDYNDFVRNQVHAGGAAVWLLSSGGAAVWLLSSADATFQPFVAVDSSGNRRNWFTDLITFLNP